MNVRLVDNNQPDLNPTKGPVFVLSGAIRINQNNVYKKLRETEAAHLQIGGGYQMEKIRSCTAHPISIHMALRRRKSKNGKAQVGRVRDIKNAQKELRIISQGEKIVKLGGFLEMKTN